MAGRGELLLRVEEAGRNRERKYPAALERFAGLVASVTLTEHQPRLSQLPGLPGKDQPIYQAALRCRADVLLTGASRTSGPS